MFINILLVGLGGFAGAILRYLLTLIPIGGNFPFITLIINTAGGFMMGFFVGFFNGNTEFEKRLILFSRTGLCGGFTTLSAMSLECINLFENKHCIMAVGYAVISVVFCIAGMLLGRFLIARIRG